MSTLGLEQGVHPVIIGTGGELGSERLTNDDLIARTGITSSDEAIRRLCGIESRYWVADGEHGSDLGTRAAEMALKNAGLTTADVGELRVSTSTPDYPSPSTASIIHGKLNLPAHIPAADVNAACAGGVYAVRDACNALRDPYGPETVLAVGTEILSKGTNHADRKSVILFGDGAGAAVLQNRETNQPPVFAAITQPAFDAINVPAGGIVQEASGPGDPKRRINMNGRKVAAHAITHMPAALRLAACRAGIGDGKDIDWDKIDLLVPHQANLRLIEFIGEDLQAPAEKVVTTVQEHGNTSSASWLLGLNSAIERGDLKPGMNTVATTAIGAGMVAMAGVMSVFIPPRLA